MAARRLPRRAHPPIKKIAWAAQPVCNLHRRVVVGKIARIGELRLAAAEIAIPH
jgi:hypothetical protein